MIKLNKISVKVKSYDIAPKEFSFFLILSVENGN